MPVEIFWAVEISVIILYRVVLETNFKTKQMGIYVEQRGGPLWSPGGPLEVHKPPFKKY